MKKSNNPEFQIEKEEKPQRSFLPPKGRTHQEEWESQVKFWIFSNSDPYKIRLKIGIASPQGKHPHKTFYDSLPQLINYALPILLASLIWKKKP